MRLRTAVDLLVVRVSHWTENRWTQPVNPEAGPLTKADLMYALAQTLADLDADAEPHDRRPVPRLDNDLALVDQVRVMVADLLHAPAPDPVLDRATAAITTATAAL